MKPSRLLSSVFIAGSLLSMPTATLATAADTPKHTRAAEWVGETVADRPSKHYQFAAFNLSSKDGQRHYRIQFGIPSVRTPRQNILYMLDGNAAIATLTDADLAELSRGHPPVLVAIGYDVPTRNDVVSRAYDYTPPVVRDGQQLKHPVVRGRVGGGADAFLELIESQIKPRVKALTDANGEEWIWGHSYAGLFALHVLFTRPESFDAYVVGDPSAWWHDGALFRTWEDFDPSRAAGKRVDILVGTLPRPPGRPAPDDILISTADGRQITPRAAIQEMATGLHRVTQVVYQQFPQAGHGDMIRVSLAHTLRKLQVVDK